MPVERPRPNRVLAFRASTSARRPAGLPRLAQAALLLAVAAGAGACASTSSNPAAFERLQRTTLRDEFVSSNLPNFEPMARKSYAFQGPNGMRQAGFSLQLEQAVFAGVEKPCLKLFLEWENGAFQGRSVEILFDREAARARTSIPELAALPNPAEQITHVCIEFLDYHPDWKPLAEYLKSLGRNASRR